MGRGLRVGRVLGVDIVLDVSWLFIAALVTLSLYAQLTVFDDEAATSAGLRWVLAALGSLLFFGSVLAHELSHAMVARRRGINVRRIRLFIFGGVAEIEKEAATPQDELAITLAGPVSSLVLAGLFYGLDALLPEVSGAPGALLPILAFVNLALGIFNLVPGFPLDGGRVLRAMIWRFTGNYRAATRVASIAGQVVGGALVAVGTWLLLAQGNAAGLWYMAIGWFLFQAARAAGSFGLARDTLAGRPVGELMHPIYEGVPSSATLQEVFDHFLRSGNVPVVPVIADGRVRGLVDLAILEGYPRAQWSSLRAGQVMRRLQPFHVVAADDDMGDVLDRMAGHTPVVFVVAEGRVVGVLTTADAARWVARSELIERQGA